jgi:RNA polymerase sigma-70 factor (ECF subfamily)
VPSSPDIARFEAQVRRHRDDVYRLACHLLGDTTEAADVTQDVLVRLWDHRAEVEDDKTRAWLLRTARNACLDVLRHRTVRRDALTVSTEGLRHAPARTPQPDASAEAADFHRHLWRALQTLDEPYRSLVILREMQGLPYDDLADILDLSMSQVKVYLHRARRRLRKQLSTVTNYELA